MRTTWLGVLLLIITWFHTAMAEDLFASLAFSDGRSRSDADVQGKSVVTIWFCGHCPSAGAYMREQAKTLHDRLAELQRPVVLVLITPDIKPAALVTWASERGFTEALIAHAPQNQLDISTSNILQVLLRKPEGNEIPLSFSSTNLDVIEPIITTTGTYRIAPDGLTHATVRSVWWAIEQDRPDAVKLAAKAAKQAKKNAEAGPQMERLMTAVAAVRDAEFAALPSAPTMAAYEQLEALANRYAGIDGAAIQERLKAWTKDPALKDELAARNAWRTLNALLTSNAPADQAKGRGGMAQLAKRYPETVYGRRAASL